jgi:hypothetical protein
MLEKIVAEIETCPCRLMAKVSFEQQFAGRW